MAEQYDVTEDPAFVEINHTVADGIRLIVSGGHVQVEALFIDYPNLQAIGGRVLDVSVFRNVVRMTLNRLIDLHTPEGVLRAREQYSRVRESMLEVIDELTDLDMKEINNAQKPGGRRSHRG